MVNGKGRTNDDCICFFRFLVQSAMMKKKVILKVTTTISKEQRETADGPRLGNFV